MSKVESILALEYMPVSVVGGARKAAGSFLRYIQFRDHHPDSPSQSAIKDYVRYVAHRDRTCPGGRIFGRDGEMTTADRRHLVEHVARSTRGLQPRWAPNPHGRLEDRQRAVYQMVLSPADWRGLDLRALARATMAQLEADSGGLGPWFAAEHRNTAHHHVHIVLAARREMAPGQFRTVLITRRRLERMKQAMNLEMSRQRRRGPLTLEIGVTRQLAAPLPPVRNRPRSWRHHAHLRRLHALAVPSAGTRAIRGPRSHMRSLAVYFHRQMQRALYEEQRSRELEGWLR